MLNVIVVFQIHALHPLAAALLLTIGSNGEAFHVSRLRNRNNHVFFGNEVFYVKILRGLGKKGTTRSVELLLNLLQLFFDDLANQRGVFQNALVVGNLFQQLGQFAFDLLALQTGEAAQAHLKNGVSLLLRQTKALG